ncbi:hypothetical protein METUNv1_01684 [Methyloversatilis universalis FAM5]|uniref:HK97 gp10 family phage protein n=1 Tax=Methyloversatilis universalis (strain ATCC BAA-1314 / DSM 25237 / JCM 13912 / CCUG 52030 / FAM5) TaxID=1000565 RepID=F5RC43_METUF|nr:hypothetical protein [Methyloversatilis universalis]EGK71906.1 hypothetical protein METUNv1_01684 [Methyloversatilis universalis FAM5]
MSDFMRSIDRFIAKANGNVDKAVRQTVVLCAQGVVLRTPVDTGRARGNWVLGVGTINSGTSAANDPSGAGAIGRIAAEVAASRGRVFYVTNSLPYIQRLEDGYSKQAPAGMVKATLAALPAAIDRYARSLA